MFTSEAGPGLAIATGVGDDNLDALEEIGG